MSDPEITYLPLDTPDDDPRWAGWLRQMRRGFLEPAAEPSELEKYIVSSRADGARNFGVLEGGSEPVATLASLDRPLNVGHGRLLPANLLTDATVRATHRRRGLLRTMITHDLHAAKERGAAFSVLTASEGSIYGRFGFGVATRLASAEVDARKFHLRRPVTGGFAYVSREEAGAAYDELEPQMMRQHRGAFGRMWFHRALFTGQLKGGSAGENALVQHVVHRDDEGRIDGAVAFEPVPDSDPGQVKVNQLLAATPEAARSLWGFLASLDLVDVLAHRSFRLDDPLSWALVDPRAIRVTRVYDMLWLRVLDPERALAERGWDREGSLTLRVDDPLGLADGTFALEVAAGRATVTRAEAAPDASVDVETLGSLYLGGVDPAALAAAGRIGGDGAAVARLFAVDEPAYSPVGF